MGVLKQRRQVRDGVEPVGNSRRQAVSDSASLWLAPSPSKRWGELFFLAYSPVWIVLCLVVIVPFKIYEQFKEAEYLALGLLVALPCLLLPLFIVGKADRATPWYDRYWTKANLWIAIFGFVGNYFWTHYFYTVLAATYTFPSWKLNSVPLPCFLLTHAYFLFYHMISNMTLRRLQNALRSCQSRALSWFAQGLWILTLAYVTALMEAITIAYFPYYDMVDRPMFYKFGSLFYAIYFVVSFPMFLRLDEDPDKPWTLWETAVNSLGAAMLVTIFLDLWRISLGPLVEIPGRLSYQTCLSYGLPWLS